MDRKSFLKLSAASLVAMHTEGVHAKIFDTAAQNSEGLLVRFLGTGAADWNGMDSRGEHRRLSSILLDSRTLVDLTPSCLDMIPAGVQPDTIIYTHSHGDHYNPMAAIELGIRRVYVHEGWSKEASAEFRAAAEKAGKSAPQVVALSVGKAVEVEGVRFMPLPANHTTGRQGEQALIFLIEKGDVRLLYASDTAGIPAEASRLAGLDLYGKFKKPITALIMEATIGLGHDDDFRVFTHSSVSMVAHAVRVLTKIGRYRPKKGQSVWLTHMARTLHGTQAELDKLLPKPLKAAYDGLEIEF